MKNLYKAFVIIGLFTMTNTISAQCYKELHTPFDQDAWASCTPLQNPNPDRGVGHWIMYDLGHEYVLDSTQIWNYNAWTNSMAGLKDVIIDYSLDASNWIELGQFEFPQAPSSIKYEGFAGPKFGNVPARYVLISATSNWGHPDCYGLAEIKLFVGEMSTSVEEPEEKISLLSIEVQPNPVQDFARVLLPEEELPQRIGLFDISGRAITEQSEVTSRTVQFDMADLPGGIYVVKAWFNEEIISRKIVKVNI